LIIQLRVDDRLIHGQVVLLWAKEFATKGILVANDHAASDSTQAATLKMACPQDQKLLIRSVKDAIKVANDPRAKGMRIFALTDNIGDALALVQGAPGMVQSVNIANVGRFDRSDDDKKVVVASGVTLNPDEVIAAQKLCETGVSVIRQNGPTDPSVRFSTLLEKLKK
jgi:PTS system mannose-specific IIB component